MHSYSIPCETAAHGLAIKEAASRGRASKMSMLSVCPCRCFGWPGWWLPRCVTGLLSVRGRGQFGA
ncbi:hypothetical protein Mapa_015983 [Marchantia paleacea]|nr:hypothetical protein Mapa_015983 [Marchantia paleacea]